MLRKWLERTTKLAVIFYISGYSEIIYYKKGILSVGKFLLKFACYALESMAVDALFLNVEKTKKDLIMKTLVDIIILRGDIEKIYKSDIDLTLWRAVYKEPQDDTINPLYPDLIEKTLPNGRIRFPDISTFVNEDGVLYVKSEEGKGASLSDRAGIFGHKKWGYIVIPAGTALPDEIVITKDHYVSAKESWHYSISPNYDMPVTDFFSALDKLALAIGQRIKVERNARY